MTHPETAPYAEGCMNLSTMPSQGYCAGPQEEEQTAVDAPAVGEKAPAPELGAAPGSEVVPGASDSHMGAVDKIPPASAATAAATNGEDNIRDILKGARVVKGRFPRTANPGETLVRRDPNTGAPTHYQRYDADGLPIKRVDLTGRPHGGVPTPHVLEFERNVNPKTGEVFVRPNRCVRAARPEEIP